jgi:hypothetical protein
MAVPHSARFSFRGIEAAQVTGIQVETPSAVIVDMSGVDTPAGNSVQVPTGEIRGGSVTVDFIAAGGIDPQGLVGKAGFLFFTSSAYGVGRQAILESARITVQTADVVRGQLTFRMTDYYG